jgi:peptide/nickel transport system substrate-binding protein
MAIFNLLLVFDKRLLKRLSAPIFGAIAALGFVTSAFAGDIPGNPIIRGDQVVFETSHPIQDPTNFNWFFPESTRDDGAQQAMWEPLFLLDYNTGKLEQWLALDLMPDEKDKDHKTWKLILRDGVEWSDSAGKDKPGYQPFTAADVIFTVQMAIGVITNKSGEALDLPAMEAVTLRAQVAGVKQGTKPDGTADPLSVIFTLKAPNPRFKLENFGGAMFSSFLIMPKHIWDAKDRNGKKIGEYDKASQFRPAPIGTGPYVFSSYDQKLKRMTWTLNDNWWGTRAAKAEGWPRKLPEPLQLIWQVIDNVTGSKTMLAANDLDAAREYSLIDFNDAKQNPKVIGWDAASTQAWNNPCAVQLDVNTQYARDAQRPKDLTPWQDSRLRQALSLLIDRKNLVHNAYGDTTIPSRSLFVEYGGMKPYIDPVVTAKLGPSPAKDPVAADAQLLQAGYRKNGGDQYYKANDGTILSAKIKVDGGRSTDVDGANEIAVQLNAAGIMASVGTVPHLEYWGKTIPTGDYEIAYEWLSCGSVAEPYTSLNRYAATAVDVGQISPGYNNTGRWQGGPANNYASIVNQLGLLAPSDALMPTLVTKAYQILHDEMPVIPLVQSPSIIPFNTKYWTGWPTAANAYGVPMHSWLATHRIIHHLKRS